MARQAVAARPAGCDQTGIISDAPVELEQHIVALQANTQTAAVLAEGFTVRLVDLSRVIALQPHIYTEHATTRVADVDPADIRAVASVSLPIPTPAEMPVQFDESRKAWIFSSPNPNLRIAGHFGGQIQPGVTGFGFVVTISKSYLQVAKYQGRYLLRDGYHRAYGLLRRGITFVPALVREFASFGELALPAGLLSQDEFLGSRPLLPDYLNDEVSAPIQMAATQKMVVVQGLELSTLS